MRTTRLSGAIALSLAAAVLSSCGSGSDSGSSSSGGDYCQELKDDKAYFASLSGDNPDLSKLDDMFQRMHTLADDSPDEVADDWKTLDNAVTTIENALKEAGLKPSDLAQMQNGQVPQGVDIDKLQALAPKLQALNSDDVSSAADRIAKNAKDQCGVELNGN